jgi:glycosyltransferase involved in cell wall biosynthesis
MKRRVLFYSDARDFGGHEYMTIAAARFMSKQPSLVVSFAYYEKNSRLHQHLCNIREECGLTLYPLRVKAEGSRGLRTLFWISKLPFLQRRMESLAPDVVVVSQGNIEISSLGLVAAKRASLRTISYIPLAQKIAPPSRLGSCRDAVDRYLYQLPDKFITISEGVKQMLRKRGVKVEISVVRNGIEFDSGVVEDKAKSRAIHGFSEDEYIIAVVGRIVFRQKAQDLLVSAVSRYREQLRGVRFCVVGDGPDEQELREIIRERKLAQWISILPWSRELGSLYVAADMLLIPSRFEGVPLVMLEAMWYRVPIVASNVDGMAEILPAEWLFQCGDAESLVKAISRVRYADNAHLLAANRKKVLEEFSMSQFQNRFCEVVLKCSHSLLPPPIEQTVECGPLRPD